MIILILIVALLIRLLLAPFLTYHTDFNYWLAWSERLTTVGLASFYNNWSDYLPSYLYILAILGWIKQFFQLANDGILTLIIFKLPAITADIGCGFLIYLIAKRWMGPKRAKFIAALYLFNPAIVTNSALWGQVDGFLPFLFLLTSLLIFRQRLLLGGIIFGVLILFKLQAVFWLLPVLLYLGRRTLIFAIGVATSLVLLFLPFISGPAPQFLAQRFATTTGQYPFASVNAFNFWTVLFLNSRSDQLLFGPLTLQIWGVVLFLIIAGLIVIGYFRQQPIIGKEKSFILVSMLIIGASFLFLTRAHERHFLAFIALFALALTFLKKEWLLFYAIFSLGYVINLLVSFAWKEWGLLLFYESLPFALSIVNLMLFGWLMINLATKKQVTRTE